MVAGFSSFAAFGFSCFIHSLKNSAFLLTLKKSPAGISNTETAGMNLEFNDLDYSILLGFEYGLNEKWKFQTRYSNSIIPFRDFDGDPIGPILRGQYHSVLMFKI